MSKIIECVPNFSEGRDTKIINAIADAVRNVEGVTLLDVDPGKSTNRTVYTFVGDPVSIVEGALAAAKVAYNMIDMSKHSGEHPRMGALDVCPFIPVRNVTVEEAVQVSKNFGSRLAKELNVPVFLYGYAAKESYRSTMPQIRAGEYEKLAEKLKQPEWKPDFGEPEFVSSWGATVTGVRKFLIAYNVNMVATKEQAHKIALNLREKGRGENKPGRLQAVQGIGWWLEEANIAQISLNLTDMDVTPMHVAYEEAKKDAEKMKLGVIGSEIVGLVPLSAILEAAEYYIKKEGLFVMEEDQKVQLAINRLGLSTLSPFNPKQRIIEYCLPQGDGPLISQSVKQFVLSVGARTPAPGGGSVSALVGAMGSSLCAMMAKLSFGRSIWEKLDPQMRRLIPLVDGPSREMIEMIDADTDAFNDYMAALKLPQNSEEEKEIRLAAMDMGLKKAVAVPLSLAKKINETWKPIEEIAEIGNINCKSDLEVGAKCLETAVFGAYRNVAINLKDIKDQEFVQEITKSIQEEVNYSTECCQRILKILESRT